ncbi:MAG TPA: DUF6542 domain-containing protein [Nocardioides sp.]|nr:DUF6542 domain-containing protein [Nocardioides sp.]
MSHAPTIWEEGREPGHEIAALVVALLLTATTLDVLLSQPLGLLFDLVFVTLCVGAALAVRPRDFFAVGVLPPLAMFATVLLLAIAQPEAVAHPQDGVVQATVTGLSRHGVALAVGYFLCLGLLALRRRALERQA